MKESTKVSILFAFFIPTIIIVIIFSYFRYFHKKILTRCKARDDEDFGTDPDASTYSADAFEVVNDAFKINENDISPPPTYKDLFGIN